MICKWLETATKQEVFDKAYLGLMAQGRPSTNHSGWCFYRSGENNELKCAAGFLISDEEYTTSIETYWQALVERGEVPDKHGGLIVRLQDAHDRDASEDELPENFRNRIKERFEDIARENGLTIPQVQGVE